MDLGLKDKKALVCASSQGLGYACALALAQEGCEVYINGRQLDKLQEAAKSLRTETGQAVMPIQADLNTHEGRLKLLLACPQPDILINNNAGPPPGQLSDWDHTAWMGALESNLLSAALLMREVIPGMRQRRFGRIVNITSAMVKSPHAAMGLSTAARAGLTALSKALESTSELEQSNLKIRLANAGFSKHTASRNFLAIKVVSLGFGLFVGGSYGFYSAGFAKNSWMALVIGGGMGFFLPELVLTLMKWSRQQKIFLQLPDALDLLVVCVEAGLGLDSGLRRVSDELVTGAPEVCSELATANMQLQMGKPRRDVLHDLGIRTGVDDVRALAAILIQADRFGSSIAQALRVQSDTMRVKRRQMAEEKAAQTAVKMIFPLVLFIFPGIFVVLVGPAAIQLMENMLNK